MAQLVKLEPGDVLVLANVGDDVFDAPEHLEWLKEHLQLDAVLVFAGDVDLSRLPPDAS